MNEATKLLTPDQRKLMVLPFLRKELENLPDEGAFGSNDESIKELRTWIKELETGIVKSEEVEYFLKPDFNTWRHSCLCDYLN